MPLVSFLIYAAINGTITPDTIFPALSLWQGLFQPILTVPQAITSVIVAQVSWKRLVTLLLADEAEALDMLASEVKHAEPVANNADSIQKTSAAITATAAQFKWEEVQSKNESDKSDAAEKPAKKRWGKPKAEAPTEAPAAAPAEETVKGSKESEGDAFCFSPLSFSIPRGKKVAIVGPVGAGKSSLLSGLIGEMPKSGGEVSINGSVAYCAQQPWILTDSIRGNIVFNQPNDQDRLDAILRVCGLDVDLTQFPAGVNTEIGEKGVNLSGGQKARVSLARALYFNPDILLLDDPLSALDAQVGRKVFDEAIKKYLKTKTVVLVTHQLHFLPEMDYIIVLDKGTLAEQGTYKELMEKGAVLARLMKDYSLDDEETAKKNDEKGGDAVTEGKGGIIVEEDKERGSVSLRVFKHYFDKCGGWTFIALAVLSALLNAGAQVMTNLWLSWWSSNKYNFGLDTYMRVYGILGVGQFCFALVINTVFLAGCYKAAKYYHPVALKSLLRAPMGFFDSQPIGRILNRMSKDVESIDQNLWILMFLTTIATAGGIANLAFLCYVDTRMLALVCPLIVVYFLMLKYYQRSNIELKRFEAVNKSPLYAHVSETMAGISTVKAYGVEASFIDRQRQLMNVSNVPTFLRLMAQVWISLRLGILSSSLTFLLCILGATSAIEPALIGVALTYAIGFANLLALLLTSASSLENEFNSVERLQVYCMQLPQESAATLSEDPSPAQWPQRGQISFNDISLSYPSRPDVLILKKLGFSVNAGEKVGVIGRTGSGKSTLMTALFRIVDLKEGSIVIDGVDIARLGLDTVRKAIQIIPQEPVLFSGTIRENLDVESLYPDEDIWSVLERIGLKEYVSSLNEKLQAPVVENGENLSVGQRQLICLGRAILVKPKILIMDEATASVDGEADKLIQESIKTYFKDTTVLSIAHRLNTIADFDRVLVLQEGEKIEYDTPYALLSNPTSLFSTLADATGAANAALLRTIAAAKHRARDE
ncbi:hypothetical protein HDU91_000820 [Kappamyces sp. JEL0680]|nr:hypothetical protein HDU91_000820 [Kappamyces sp. JEL0680]